jgi:hypothetical protein
MVTHTRILFISLLLILETNWVNLFPQSADYFDGKVINSTTLHPVPFATIKLKTNQLGVYANAEGDFKIARNVDFQNDSLIITCIGFKQSSLAYKDLNEFNVNRVLLVPVVYGLGEVRVVAKQKKLNSLAIIRKAIRKIIDNYPVKPYNYIAYYRDYQKRDNNYFNLNEAIIQTLDNGFMTESISDKYRLLDFRKNNDFPRMNVSPYYEMNKSSESDKSSKSIPKVFLDDQFGNEFFILRLHDAIRNFNVRSFSYIETFSKDFLYNHNFSDPVKVFNNNLMLYKIEFEGKRLITHDSVYASGAIYIQPRDYSIHKLEYSCYYKTRSEASKKIFNIDVEYGYDNSVDSLMCLKYISFNNFFKVEDPTDSSYFKILESRLDTHSNIKSTVILKFSNNLDPVSASKKENFDVTIDKKAVKINHIQVVRNNVYLRLNDEDVKGRTDSITVLVHKVKDLDGNMVDQRKSIELYQFRELFVQEYNKHLPLTDSCYMEYLPLEKNCISKYSGSHNYWMNTPENIKNNK